MVSVTAWAVQLKLHDSSSSAKRGKLSGVSGASVFSFVGATAPADISAWKFQGNTGRTRVDVVFPNTNVPGAQVWPIRQAQGRLTAFWFNGRKQSGPACSPVSAHIQGASVSMAA